MIIALLLALAASDQPSAVATASVVVSVDPSDAGQLVDASRIAEAVALRISGAPVDVLTARRAGEAAWVADVVPHGSGFVEVSITSPEGRLVRRGNLSLQGRKADDVTQTIALWVIEALTPVMPELTRDLPREHPQVVEPGPAPRPASSSPPLTGAVRVGVSAQRLWSTQRTLGLLALEGELGLGRHLTIVPGLDISTSFGESDTTFAVNARRAAATLAVGWRWQLAPVTLFAHAGPMLRGLRLSASGDGIAFTDRTFVNAGAELSAGVMTRDLPVDVGISLRGERYFSRPDVHVDGVPVLDLGASAIACNVWVQYLF